MENKLEVTNLLPAEIQATESLPEKQKFYVEARFKKPIREYEPFDLEKGLKNLILVSFAELGIKDAVDDKVTTFLRTTLFNDLKAPKYNHLTLEEIKLAIGMGIRGEYGTFKNQLNTLNIQNIFFWIKSFVESKARELALKEFNKKADQLERAEKPVILNPETEKAGLIKYFQDYKQTKKLGFFPFAHYELIKKYKGVKSLVTIEVFREIRRETEAQRRKELEAEKKRALTRKETSTAEAIDKVFEIGLDKDQVLINRQKEKCLLSFFDSLIKEGRELEL